MGIFAAAHGLMACTETSEITGRTELDVNSTICFVASMAVLVGLGLTVRKIFTGDNYLEIRSPKDMRNLYERGVLNDPKKLSECAEIGMRFMDQETLHNVAELFLTHFGQGKNLSSAERLLGATFLTNRGHDLTPALQERLVEFCSNYTRSVDLGYILELCSFMTPDQRCRIARSYLRAGYDDGNYGYLQLDANRFPSETVELLIENAINGRETVWACMFGLSELNPGRRPVLFEALLRRIREKTAENEAELRDDLAAAFHNDVFNEEETRILREVATANSFEI